MLNEVYAHEDVLQKMWRQAQAVDRNVQAAVLQESGQAPEAPHSFTVVLEGARSCNALPEAFIARVLGARSGS